MGEVFNFAIFERDLMIQQKDRVTFWPRSFAQRNGRGSVDSQHRPMRIALKQSSQSLKLNLSQTSCASEASCMQQNNNKTPWKTIAPTGKILRAMVEQTRRQKFIDRQKKFHRGSSFLAKARNRTSKSQSNSKSCSIPQSIPFESPKTTMNQMNDLCWLQTAFQAEASTRSHIWLPLCFIATRMERNWDQYCSFQRDELHRDKIFFFRDGVPLSAMLLYWSGLVRLRRMKTITVIMKTRRAALAFPPHYCLQRGPAITNYSKTWNSSHKYAEVSCMFVHCFGMFVFQHQCTSCFGICCIPGWP